MKNDIIQAIYEDLCFEYVLIGKDLWYRESGTKTEFPVFKHDFFILRFRNKEKQTK